jgi:hypothetical protein
VGRIGQAAWTLQKRKKKAGRRPTQDWRDPCVCQKKLPDRRPAAGTSSGVRLFYADVVLDRGNTLHAACDVGGALGIAGCDTKPDSWTSPLKVSTLISVALTVGSAANAAFTLAVMTAVVDVFAGAFLGGLDAQPTMVKATRGEDGGGETFGDFHDDPLVFRWSKSKLQV